VLTAFVVAALIAALAYCAGEHHQRPLTILTGHSSVGYRQATVTVAGWSYGINGSVPFWVDQQGDTNAGGWPTCLSKPGQTVLIKFGEIPVTEPDGTGLRQVVWLDCRG
jgi:hypothetical protein